MPKNIHKFVQGNIYLNADRDSLDKNTLSMKNVSYGGQQFSLTIKTNEQEPAHIMPMSTSRSRTSKENVSKMNSARDKNDTSPGKVETK